MKGKQIRWSGLASVGFVILALMVPASVAADALPVDQNFRVPLSMPTVNPCNGEAVLLQGETHFQSHTTANGTTYLVALTTNTNLQGPGAWGNNYVDSSTANDTNKQTVPQQSVFEYLTVRHLVTSGSQNNFVAMLHFHLTINAGGVITAQGYDYQVDCR